MRLNVTSTLLSAIDVTSTASSSAPGDDSLIHAKSWPASRAVCTASPGTFSSARNFGIVHTGNG